jgi:hypothetical protein
LTFVAGIEIIAPQTGGALAQSSLASRLGNDGIDIQLLFIGIVINPTTKWFGSREGYVNILR